MTDSDKLCWWRGNDQVKSGLHVLLIGVSNYPYAIDGQKADSAKNKLGIRQLSGPALSVSELARWLVENKNSLSFPLKSVRVLASPSATEAQADPEFANFPRALLANVSAAARGWQSDAAATQDGATLFYFAGHGIQRSKGDSIMLLEDFLSDESNTYLERTIGLNNIYNGMANFNRWPNLATTQFYVVDACRADVKELAGYERQEPTALFPVELGGVDDRTAPIFFAAASGRVSYNARGVGTLFWNDLRACLEGGGAEKLTTSDGTAGWFVTIGKLNDALCRMVNQFNAGFGAELRSFNLDKFDAKALTRPIRVLAQAPKVRCKFDMVPTEAGQYVTVTLGVPGVWPPETVLGPGSSFTCEKEAGIYIIGGVFDDAHRKTYRDYDSAPVSIMPPFFNYSMYFK